MNRRGFLSVLVGIPAAAIISPASPRPTSGISSDSSGNVFRNNTMSSDHDLVVERINYYCRLAGEAHKHRKTMIALRALR